MSLLSRLFGKAPDAASEGPAETHDGFAIYPDPIEENGRFRIAARIEKDIDGERRSHRMVRADVLDEREAAVTATLGKARKLIDEQGERLFD